MPLGLNPILGLCFKIFPPFGVRLTDLAKSYVCPVTDVIDLLAIQPRLMFLNLICRLGNFSLF